MKQLWQKFWLFVWETSEFFYIDLGRFAPFVFGQMIGRKGHRVDAEKEVGQESL